MLLVLSKSFNPFINLATEEVLLKQKTDNIIMLWRSETAVIVGKHQNALSEVNYRYLCENNIPIARRLSGGGTVVHDLQNLNFTFIANGEDGKLIDFKRYLNPIIEYLATLGIEAHIGKTNDLRINDLKISGNAEHVYRKRILHHGTLLFNSDLNQLRRSIDVAPEKYIDKAVQSNRSSVTNIANHLAQNMSIEIFTAELFNFLKAKYKGNSYQLSNDEHSAINKLAKEKYAQPEWIWGYSPKYKFNNTFNYNNSKWEVEFHVEKGIIKTSNIQKDGHQQALIEQSIINKPHLRDALQQNLPTLKNEPLNEEFLWNLF